MSTDEVKKLIVDGDIFMQDKDGEISKIAEIQNLESVQENNQDDAADAVRYAIEKEKSKSVSITITRESSIHLQKMLGIERISRKRFIKLLMGCRIQRNDAADAVRYAIEKEKSKSVSITITRESSIHLQKMLGIERISRKRFIKLLMGCRIQRNDANIFADIVGKNEYGYCPIMVQAVIEWVIKEIQKGEE